MFPHTDSVRGLDIRTNINDVPAGKTNDDDDDDDRQTMGASSVAISSFEKKKLRARPWNDGGRRLSSKMIERVPLQI